MDVIAPKGNGTGSANTQLRNTERNATQPVVQDLWVFGGAMGSL